MNDPITEPLPRPIVGFLPTAFTPEGAVDSGKMKDLADLLARHGIRPAVLGGMGEFYALRRDEARLCMEAAVAGAVGRVPVVAGIGSSTREATELATDARDAGVSVLVLNPHYFAVPTPDGAAEHVRRITGESGLPAIVYSSKTQPATEDHLERLTAVTGFHGVKETAFGPDEVRRRVARWGDRIEWWGVGEIGGTEYARAGGKVVTSSLANFSPATSAAYVRAALNGESVDPELAECCAAWDALLRAPEGYLGVLKAVMRELYGWHPAVRLPMTEAGAASRESVARFLERFRHLSARSAP
ncbi:dihydrodipicolinate synthase family protein [Sinosporangium siamense]|uniref:Dihydrodipicolinate synthase family protein n=1 Tax=Sinosporangium siamense TaxID=1367973 RepID=A0A919RCW8_9ACTN|nr:dihydrodipicolinate synthase family protein [Sinosporangium siamense]GII91600.1 dihydrodipicolinate synthase family protein [Sinosporangium siamense]